MVSVKVDNIRLTCKSVGLHEATAGSGETNSSLIEDKTRKGRDRGEIG